MEGDHWEARRRWDNIRRDLREVGVRDENWLDIAQDRIQC